MKWMNHASIIKKHILIEKGGMFLMQRITGGGMRADRQGLADERAIRLLNRAAPSRSNDGSVPTIGSCCY